SSSLVQRHWHQVTETMSGQLLQFKSRLQVGPLTTIAEGRVEGSELAIVKTRGAAVTTTTLAWSDEHRGLFAVEESIRRSPLQVGEQRTFASVAPLQQLATTVRLNCVATASVPLLDGDPHELLEIEVETELGEGQKNYYVIWAEADGSIRRVWYPSSQLQIYRTQEAIATKGIEREAEAIGMASSLVKGGLERAEESRRVGFKLTRTTVPLAAAQRIVRPPPTQVVRELDEASRLVLVSMLGEAAPAGFQQDQLPVTEADRQPNAIIDSGETMLRRIAQAAVGAGQLDDRELALELTRSANRLTQQIPASATFQRASDVARSAQGDSTAYAVLLAALLRAKGVASRVAFGFRYQETPDPRMLYHAWTLAHVDGQWLPLDATTGGLAAADRLTIATSDLSEPDPRDAIRPVLDFLGAFELEIVASTIRY
ncbi:MAG: transglutaminase domain-containing protein, partial [Novipirellula sp. JB048]